LLKATTASTIIHGDPSQLNLIELYCMASTIVCLKKKKEDRKYLLKATTASTIIHGDPTQLNLIELYCMASTIVCLKKKKKGR
jgi:hypothetical protein